MKKEDRIIIHAFGNGTQKEVNQAIDLIYKQYFDVIRILVVNNSGGISDAEDIFQETLIVFYRNVQKEKFKGNSSIKTYLYSIARNLWFNKIKSSKKGRKFDIEEISDEDHPVELIDLSDSDDRLKRLALSLLQAMKPGCKNILTDFYYNKLSIETIQKKYSYGSSQVVRTKKYRCLKKLTEEFNRKRPR